MQLRPLGRRDRVLERLLDDRMDEPRRKARMQELGIDQRVDRVRRRVAVHARDFASSASGCVLAEDRQRLRDDPDRRRASRQPVGHESSHRRGPMAAIAAASRSARSPPRSSSAAIS